MDINDIKAFAKTFKSFGVFMTNPDMATFKNKNDAVEFAECVDWTVSYNYSMGGYNCIQRF